MEGGEEEGGTAAGAVAATETVGGTEDIMVLEEIGVNADMGVIGGLENGNKADFNFTHSGLTNSLKSVKIDFQTPYQNNQPW